MGLKFFDFFRPKNGTTKYIEVACEELFEAAKELQIRELCFWTCVNLIANAVGRCEFRTFKDGEEVYQDEYYLWNYEPNANENSTMFLHKLIASLFANNEVLVIDTKQRNGKEALVVADSFTKGNRYPTKQNEYTNVVVGDLTYDKTFKENQVLHLVLNHTNMREVVNGVYESYSRLYEAAVKAYKWYQGQHWKVHVGQLASGEDEFTGNFAKMMEEQIKPFLESDGAVLPEFDGYKYENMKPNSTMDTRDIRNLVEDIFDFTARGFLIPAVLVNGKVEATADANTRLLTNCVDPICDQLQEEIVRKRYGLEEWKKGNYLRVDSSSIIHFDLFANAPNVEKLVGSGAFTINDVLRAANQATINEEWADQHFMTLNISPMNQVTRQLGTQEGGKA